MCVCVCLRVFLCVLLHSLVCVFVCVCVEVKSLEMREQIYHMLVCRYGETDAQESIDKEYLLKLTQFIPGSCVCERECMSVWYTQIRTHSLSYTYICHFSTSHADLVGVCCKTFRAYSFNFQFVDSKENIQMRSMCKL